MARACNSDPNRVTSTAYLPPPGDIEDDLRLRLEAAEAAARRQDELLATLAHELRSHLAPIRHAVHLGAKPLASATQQHWAFGVIERQSLQMGLLLDEVLVAMRSMSRLAALRTERVDIATVVESAIETASPLLDGRRHRLCVEMPAEAVWCDVDPLRLGQVLANLLVNAAKYTDPEGTIRLAVGATDSGLTLSVRDTGIGLAAESLESIFELYTQLHAAIDRSDHGAGVGLAIVRRLVTLHGGTIEAHSDGLGCGSEFIVRLPRYRSSGAAARGAVTAAAVRTMRRRRVLIADDSADAAEGLAMLLRLEGHEVAVALDGERALASVASLQPEFALLDLSMPVRDGYEVARAIRAGPATPVLVALTGWEDEQARARTRAAGFDYHFVKPVALAPLLELLSRDGHAGVP